MIAHPEILKRLDPAGRPSFVLPEAVIRRAFPATRRNVILREPERLKDL
jgi:hypothetical protein